MAIFSNAKAKDRARQEAARQGMLSATALEAQKAAQVRTTSAEQAKARVQGLLGAPGTFDLPGAASSTANFSDVFQSGTEATALDPTAKGLLQYKSYLKPEAKEYWATGERKDILDPEKYAGEVAKTGEFRIRSRLTSEAEQLLANEGPAWDKLQQSTIGVIMEGAGTQLRETMRDLKNQAAKGGAARRSALTTANEIIARERSIQMRVNETWQANLKLHDYVHKNAENVMEGNRKFLDNLPLISQQYTATMNGLANTLAETSKLSSTMSSAGYQARAAVGDSNFLGKLIMGTGMLIGGAALSAVGGGPLGAGMMGSGASTILGGMAGGGEESGGGGSYASNKDFGGDIIGAGKGIMGKVTGLFGGGKPVPASEGVM